MGKKFYASDPDKVKAGRKANKLARNYKKGVCWTPAKKKDCKFNEATGLWTCMAKAHHHYGSCGTWEVSPRHHGEARQLGWTWEHDVGGTPKSNGENMIDLDLNPEQISEEEYEDASPEDYIESERNSNLEE